MPPPSGMVWSETPTRQHAGTPARMLLRAHRAAARVAVGAAARRLGAPAGDAVTQQAAQAGKWGTWACEPETRSAPPCQRLGSHSETHADPRPERRLPRLAGVQEFRNPATLLVLLLERKMVCSMGEKGKPLHDFARRRSSSSPTAFSGPPRPIWLARLAQHVPREKTCCARGASLGIRR